MLRETRKRLQRGGMKPSREKLGKGLKEEECNQKRETRKSLQMGGMKPLREKLGKGCKWEE